MPPAPDQHCERLLVSGRVQGVGFRWRAREEATRLGLRGWVRNLPDGRVEVWCQGPQQAASEFRAWLAQGPPGARVDGLERRAEEPGEHAGFRIVT